MESGDQVLRFNCIPQDQRPHLELDSDSPSPKKGCGWSFEEFELDLAYFEVQNQRADIRENSTFSIKLMGIRLFWKRNFVKLVARLRCQRKHEPATISAPEQKPYLLITVG
jgi:hypothetical protein